MISSRALAQKTLILMEEGNAPTDVASALKHFLAQKNRLQLLSAVAEWVSRLSSKQGKKQTLYIQTSHNLTEALHEKIRVLLSVDTAIPVESEVRPELLSGFIATFDGRSIDTSGRAALEQLQNQLTTQS